MKTLAILVGIQAIVLTSGFAQAPRTVTVERISRTTRASTRLQLVAEPEGPSQAVGAPVFVKLKLSNIHSKAVRLSASQPEFDYRITVKDAAGVEAPLTEWGKKLRIGQAFPISQSTMDIEPGRDEQVKVEVSKVYDLRKPGTYTVSVVRNGVWLESDEDNKRFVEEVPSNSVSVTIVP